VTPVHGGESAPTSASVRAAGPNTTLDIGSIVALGSGHSPRYFLSAGVTTRTGSPSAKLPGRLSIT